MVAAQLDPDQPHRTPSLTSSTSSNSSGSRSRRSTLGTIPEDAFRVHLLKFLLVGPAAEGALTALGLSRRDGPEPSAVFHRADGSSAVVSFQAISDDSRGMPTYSARSDAENAVAIFLLELPQEGAPEAQGRGCASLEKQLGILQVLAHHLQRPGKGQHAASLGKLLLIGGGEDAMPAEAEVLGQKLGSPVAFAATRADLPEAIAALAADRLGRRPSAMPDLEDVIQDGSRRPPRSSRRDPFLLWRGAVGRARAHTTGEWSLRSARRGRDKALSAEEDPGARGPPSMRSGSGTESGKLRGRLSGTRRTATHTPRGKLDAEDDDDTASAWVPGSDVEI